MATAPKENSTLLSLVISSHGGLPAFLKTNTCIFKFNFSGAFLDHKGFPGHYQPTARISTSRPRTELRGLDLEHPSDTWVFTPEGAWTQDADGKQKQSRSRPRESFRGHTRDSKWDKLHLAYFIGYALWNYATMPFALAGPGFETREIEEHWEPGYVNSLGITESWRTLEVTFPENYPAHTRVQKLYFDREKRWIRRMDYETDVAGGIATHYCFDHIVVRGIVVPTLRRVVRRDPVTNTAMMFGPSAFILDYFDIDFIVSD